MQSVDGEVANLYQLLTDESVSTAARLEAERRLEREGVNLEKLKQDFVSHQAIHTYLRKYRNVSSPDLDDREPAKTARNRLDRLASRTMTVTEDTIESLQHNGIINITKPSVLLDLRIVCEECGGSYTVEELLSAGGCRCGGTEPECE
jgi:hypothetical protein